MSLPSLDILAFVTVLTPKKPGYEASIRATPLPLSVASKAKKISLSTEISTNDELAPSARPAICMVSAFATCTLHTYWRFIVDPPVESIAIANDAGITSDQNARLVGSLWCMSRFRMLKTQRRLVPSA